MILCRKKNTEKHNTNCDHIDVGNKLLNSGELRTEELGKP